MRPAALASFALLATSLAACKSASRNQPTTSPDARATAAPAADAAPPPIVDVTVTSVTTPAEVAQLQNGVRKTFAPEPGHKFVVVSAQLAFRTCPDGVAPAQVVHVATSQGALVPAAGDKLTASGGGIGDQCDKCNVELTLECKAGAPAPQPLDFLFAVPAELSLDGASLEYRGTHVPLPR